MVSPRDELLGHVSYSCERGECLRCSSNGAAHEQARDQNAPQCVHSCHYAQESFPTSGTRAERQAANAAALGAEGVEVPTSRLNPADHRF